MSRSAKKTGNIVGQRTKEFAVFAAKSSYLEIKSLSELYDQGEHLVFRTIASVLQRMLLDEMRIGGIQNEIPWITTVRDLSEGNLIESLPLVIWQAGGEHIEFFDIRHGPDLGRRSLTFSEWMNQDILMEGLSTYDARVRKRETASRKPIDRRKFSRRLFLRRIRNETGAHFDRDITDDWQFLEESNRFIEHVRELPDGQTVSLSSHPELFSVKNSVAGATVRSIAHEAMESLASLFDGDQIQIG